MENDNEIYLKWCVAEGRLGRCDLKRLSRTDSVLSIFLSYTSSGGLKVEFLFELKDVVGFKLSNDSYTW